MEAEFKKSGSPDLENINQKASLFIPGYKCRICEDVAETFRNTNKCRGMDHPWSSVRAALVAVMMSVNRRG